MDDKEQKILFSENLNRLLKENEKTQKEVADAIGVLTSTFNTWSRGIALPRMGKVQRLADYFNVPKSRLLEKQTAAPQQVTAIRIPVLGHVSAGIPISAITDIVDWEELPSTMVREGEEYFALKVKGDSMEPRIKDGDVVIVRQQDYADDGDIVTAVINGDDGVCKRLKKIRDGIALISSNPAYDPLVFTEPDVDALPVRIVGKVKELRAKL